MTQEIITITVISIHALREEGDQTQRLGDADGADFYPRPPRGGRRKFFRISEKSNRFLSTPSARRATFLDRIKESLYNISIHALREEGDQPTKDELNYKPDFYPRPPRGGRPVHPRAVRCPPCISIHALREEGDSNLLSAATELYHFYPRPPRGGRPPEQGQ